MNKKVAKLFEDLHLRNLPQLDNSDIFLVDDIRYKKDDNSTDKILIDGIPFFVKKFAEKLSTNNIAISRMFNDLHTEHKDFSYITPPVYTIAQNKKNPTLSTITQDINSIDNSCEYVVGYNLHQLRRDIHMLLSDSNRRYRWEILYNEDIRQAFLKYMTETCYDKLVGLYILGETRTEKDLNKGNMVFVRKKYGKKFVDVIPLDHELTQIVVKEPRTREDFLSFIKTKYFAETPLESQDNLSYISRVRDLQSIIQSGLVSKETINALKHSLEYDLSSQIDTLCQQNELFNQEVNNTSESYKYLQEYNYRSIGKELGL